MSVSSTGASPRQLERWARQAGSAVPLRFLPGVEIQLRYAHSEGTRVPDEVDCRLLFLGSRINGLVEAYADVVDRFSSLSDDTELRRALNASPSVREFYEIGDTGDGPSVVLRDAVFHAPALIDDLELVFRVRCGRRFASRRITAKRLPALGALCPLLWGTHTEAEVREALETHLRGDDARWVGAVLDDLIGATLVAPGSPPVSRFAPRPPLPRVSFLGHACVLFQTPDTSVLFDPLVRRDAGGSLQPADIAALDMDAICCTHSHWDHCNLQTLLAFDKATPVIVPRVDRPTAFNPSLAEPLRRMGFTDVREVRPWGPLTVGDVEIVPTPFHGEQDEPGVVIDRFTFVARTSGLTVYGGADCYRDSFGDMLPVVDAVRRRYRPDVAFLPIAKAVVAYRQGGSNNFCRYLDRQLLDESFQYTAGPADAARLACALDPALVVPYASFTLSRWDAPRAIGEFRRELRDRGVGERLHPLRPLESLVPSESRRPWRRTRVRAAVSLSAARRVLDALRPRVRRTAVRLRRAARPTT